MPRLTRREVLQRALRSGEVQKQSDEALSKVITQGKGKMPAFGAKLKPDDVKNW